MATGNGNGNGNDRPSGTGPPRLLSRSAEPGPSPPAIHESVALEAVRRRWAQISGAPIGTPGVRESSRTAAQDEAEAPEGTPARPPARVPGGVRAKMKARVATAAAGVQSQDRAMTGDLVGAVDALARRLDELSSRLAQLESLVQEVVDTTSEDLVRVQVALGAARDEPGRRGTE